MKKLWLTLLIIFLLSPSRSWASNVHVGASATGDGSGSDWSNQAAWSSLSFTRGNEYFLADGTYAGKIFSTATSGSTYINICKATASTVGSCSTAHGTDTGWSSTYGDDQAAFTSGIEFRTSYWVFDGVTGGGPGSWDGPYGFKITQTGDTPIIFLAQYTVADYITLKHIDEVGNGSVAGGGAWGNDGIAIYSVYIDGVWTHVTQFTTMSYIRMNEIGRCPVFIIGSGNTVFEYIHVVKYYDGGIDDIHSEVMSDGQYEMGDVTWRYSLISYVWSTGGIMWDAKDNPSAKLYVYGNVFYRPSAITWTFGNGVVSCWSASACTGMRVYNNTFINVPSPRVFGSHSSPSDNISYNNLFYTVYDVDFSFMTTKDYDHFISAGEPYGETHETTGSGDPFTNYVGLDFSLTANTTAGISIENVGSHTFNVDALGHTRTSWSRGAYEYQAEGDTTPTLSGITIIGGTVK